MIDKTISEETVSEPFNDTTFPCPLCGTQSQQVKVHRHVKDHYGRKYIHVAIDCICHSEHHHEHINKCYTFYHHLPPMPYVETHR